MIGYPLDSRVTFNNGIPEYDRAISSTPLRELYKRLFSSGVLPDIATNLMVEYVGSNRVTGAVEGETESYNVVVNPGFGICNGCLKLQEDYYGLEMNVSGTSNPRIDTIVLRLDNNDAVRTCNFHIVQGEVSATPTPPQLTRNETVWELGLANLYKPPTVSDSNPVVVTDTRLDSERCGVISSISQFDTTAIYNQVQTDVEHFKNMTEEELAVWFLEQQTDFLNWTTAQKNAYLLWVSTQQTDFNTWFDNVKGQLSEDVAGNLQLQIGTLDFLSTTNKSNLVEAINETIRQSVYRIPTRTINTLSSQALTSNPIPTGWQSVVVGTEYTSGKYKITASSYDSSGSEIYRAFDNVATTSWKPISGSQHYFIIELPDAVLIDKVKVNYSALLGATLEIQSSENGTVWENELEVTQHTGGSAEYELPNAPYVKYLRFLFSHSSNFAPMVYACGLSDYTVYTYRANYTLTNVPILSAGQKVLIQIDKTHDASGVVENTFNGVSVKTILQANKKYELMYNITEYTALEVS